MGNQYQTVFSSGLLQCCCIWVTSQPLLSLSEALHRSTSEGFPALVYLASAHGQCQHLRTSHTQQLGHTDSRSSCHTRHKYRETRGHTDTGGGSEPNLIFIPFCYPESDCFMCGVNSTRLMGWPVKFVFCIWPCHYAAPRDQIQIFMSAFGQELWLDIEPMVLFLGHPRETHADTTQEHDLNPGHC